MELNGHLLYELLCLGATYGAVAVVEQVDVGFQLLVILGCIGYIHGYAAILARVDGGEADTREGAVAVTSTEESAGASHGGGCHKVPAQRGAGGDGLYAHTLGPDGRTVEGQACRVS